MKGVGGMLYSSSRITENEVFTSGIEGPACDKEGNLYAVNYGEQGTIGIVRPDGSSEIWLKLPGGSIGNGIRFNKKGDMFIADYVNHNIFKVESGTGELSVHAHEPLMNQPNDIAIMGNGIIFASDPNWADNTGNIWRIDTDGTVVQLASNVGTTNGIEVSADERILYVNETMQRSIWAYDLNENGDISGKRLLIEFDDYYLDGMRCDIEGNIYVTRYGKGTIAKISPEGVLLREIALEGSNCTNICFGGADGKTAYVTVADGGNVQSFTVESAGRCWAMWND